MGEPESLFLDNAIDPAVSEKNRLPGFDMAKTFPRIALIPVLVRYYLRSIWPPFFLAMGIWVFILNLLYTIRDFFDYLFLYQAGLSNSLRLLLYIQPSYLVLAIPIGYLTALLVVYGRLSTDREAMALESSGVSPSLLIWPMIGVSLLMSLFLVVLMDRILPWGNTSYLRLQYQIITERSAISVHEREFIRNFEGYLLYVKEKDDKNDLLKGVTVWFLDKGSHAYRVITAQRGTLRQDPENYHVMLELNKGILQQDQAGPTEPHGEFLNMQFENCTLDLSAHKMKNGPIDFSDARNISIRDLALKIQNEKKANADVRYDELEFHKKFSIPFSALAFAFIGIPLGLVFRTGSITGFFSALILVAVYWLFIIYGQEGGPRGVISPFWAMWLPNGVLMAIGLVMVHWLNHRLDFWRSLIPRKKDPDPGREEGPFPRIVTTK